MTTRPYGCATEVAMDVLGGKWTIVILARLKQGPHRYSELRHAIPDISDKVLTDRLRKLTEHGLVERAETSTAPLTTNYRLTHEGRSLAPTLNALHAWGTHWAQEHGYETTD